MTQQQPQQGRPSPDGSPAHYTDQHLVLFCAAAGAPCISARGAPGAAEQQPDLLQRPADGLGALARERAAVPIAIVLAGRARARAVRHGRQRAAASRKAAAQAVHARPAAESALVSGRVGMA